MRVARWPLGGDGDGDREATPPAVDPATCGRSGVCSGLCIDRSSHNVSGAPNGDEDETNSVAQPPPTVTTASPLSLGLPIIVEARRKG